MPGLGFLSRAFRFFPGENLQAPEKLNFKQIKVDKLCVSIFAVAKLLFFGFKDHQVGVHKCQDPLNGS